MPLVITKATLKKCAGTNNSSRGDVQPPWHHDYYRQHPLFFSLSFRFCSKCRPVLPILANFCCRQEKAVPCKILREINFRESTGSKTAVFAIIRALNFVYLVNFNLQKVSKFLNSKFRSSKCVKKADSDILLY